jgi:hypothetical protein
MTRKDIFEKVWSETENLPYQQVVDLANQIVEYANIAIAEAQKNRTAELARREQKALSDSDKGKRFVLKASDGCWPPTMNRISVRTGRMRSGMTMPKMLSTICRFTRYKLGKNSQ